MAPNVCQNQKEVGSNHEGKTAHFVLEVKGSNGGHVGQGALKASIVLVFGNK